MIKQLVHGVDHDLFGIVGEWAMSKHTHKAMGVAITSQPGDIWFVSFDDEDGHANGYAQLRIAANGAAHLRFAGAAKPMILWKLGNAAVKTCIRSGAKFIYTNDNQVTTLWERLSFKKSATQRRGSFIKWERKL